MTPKENNATEIAAPSKKPLSPSQELATFSHYQAYHFSLDPFELSLARLKITGRTRRERSSIRTEMQRDWNAMYYTAKITLERNLGYPECDGKEEMEFEDHPTDINRNQKWNEFLKSNTDRKVKRAEELEKISVEDLRIGFEHLEDLYLQADAGSKCKGLSGLREHIVTIRGKAQAGDSTNFKRRERIVIFLRKLRTCSEVDVADRDARHTEVWTRMHRWALDRWTYNLTYEDCRYVPSEKTPNEKHTYSKYVVEKLEEVDGLEPWRIHEKIQVKLDEVRDKLYEAQDLYLNENLEKEEARYISLAINSVNLGESGRISAAAMANYGAFCGEGGAYIPSGNS
ncbi:uncharacterized protein LY89DRAFT_719620 [Mollisia scopiformis]|uniref:Uncharacterized protein n=1 Tax=Mollisia scopiformis TaxID=149040 RepID=A0A194X818_MOLSC|nr:uncharacterized protein LY89DRAFT_719620 [Mollisia scopiformis]KUJ15947.1 hypothetical protein LY89DRAFT_719620 [Mollisia scopiformis]